MTAADKWCAGIAWHLRIDLISALHKEQWQVEPLAAISRYIIPAFHVEAWSHSSSTRSQKLLKTATPMVCCRFSGANSTDWPAISFTPLTDFRSDKQIFWMACAVRQISLGLTQSQHSVHQAASLLLVSVHRKDQVLLHLEGKTWFSLWPIIT